MTDLLDEKKFYDDAEYANNKKKISKIIMYGGRILDAFQFVYDNNCVARHRGGVCGSRHEIELASDEYIIEVSGSTGIDTFAKAGRTISQIVITTNKGRKISTGMGAGFGSDLKPFKFTASQGKQIFALKGTYYCANNDTFIQSVEIGLEKTV